MHIIFQPALEHSDSFISVLRGLYSVSLVNIFYLRLLNNTNIIIPYRYTLVYKLHYILAYYVYVYMYLIIKQNTPVAIFIESN